MSRGGVCLFSLVNRSFISFLHPQSNLLLYMPSAEIRFIHTLKLCKAFFQVQLHAICSANLIFHDFVSKVWYLLSCESYEKFVMHFCPSSFHFFSPGSKYCLNAEFPNTVILCRLRPSPPCARSELTSPCIRNKQAFSSIWSYKLILTFRPKSPHIYDEGMKIIM